jgi:hypothetical protein
MVCARLVVFVKGGGVQDIIADCNVKVILVDHDTDDGPMVFPVEISTGIVQQFEDEAEE